jgi:hypothetical protein
VFDFSTRLANALAYTLQRENWADVKTIFYYRTNEYIYTFNYTVRDLTPPHFVPNPNQDLDYHGHNLSWSFCEQFFDGRGNCSFCGLGYNVVLNVLYN